MPIPDTAGDCHYPVNERIGFVAEGQRNASGPFGSADGVFDLDAAAGMSSIIGTLTIGQGRNGVLFATPGLAVGQAAGRNVVVLYQAQIAQIGQQRAQVEQARICIKPVSKQLKIMGEPACGRTQVVDVAAGVVNERVFTGPSFFIRVVGLAVNTGLRAVVGAVVGRVGWCDAGALGLFRPRSLPPLFPTCPLAFGADSWRGPIDLP